MVSRLRNLQAEWNLLVPAAQARGVRRVNLIGPNLLETIAYRQAKLDWLRGLLGSTANISIELSFGVELEVYLPAGVSRETAALRITEAGVPCHSEHYGHSIPSGSWKVTTDGSLGYDHGAEFVSPPLRGDEGFRQLQIVCRTLTGLGASVNKKCGFHVHVGVGGENIDFFKNLIRLYASAERQIDQFMPASRQGSANYFCSPVRYSADALDRATTVGQVAQAAGQHPTASRDGTRYRKLNLKSFFAYGTVEFRQHAGTCDAEKATQWVRLCLQMVLAARAGEKEISADKDFLAVVKADEAQRAYFARRAEYFARQGSRR